jgi:hypothetical protein
MASHNNDYNTAGPSKSIEMQNLRRFSDEEMKALRGAGLTSEQIQEVKSSIKELLDAGLTAVEIKQSIDAESMQQDPRRGRGWDQTAGASGQYRDSQQRSEMSAELADAMGDSIVPSQQSGLTTPRNLAGTQSSHSGFDLNGSLQQKTQEFTSAAKSKYDEYRRDGFGAVSNDGAKVVRGVHDLLTNASVQRATRTYGEYGDEAAAASNTSNKGKDVERENPSQEQTGTRRVTLDEVRRMEADAKARQEQQQKSFLGRLGFGRR